MKRLLVLIVGLFCLANAQDYLNVQLSSGYKHDLISNIKTITFSGSDVNFELNSGGGTSESMGDIIDITFGESALGDQSLPVELSCFNAILKNSTVYLNWKTESEVQNLGFDIERIAINTEWEKIGFVQGCGNSSTPNSYSFTDSNINGLKNIKYRLKQIDFDGTFEYSPEIEMSSEDTPALDEFILQNNYPNPFNTSTTITYQIQDEAVTTLKIFDMSGREISTLVNENQKPGVYKVDFNGNGLASGVYFCQITSGKNILMIKMLLMK